MATKPYGDTTYTYGDTTRLWGTNDRKFEYYVVLKTVNGSTDNDYIVKRLDKEIVSVNWEYRKYGGCGNATIVLRKPFEYMGQVEANYAIEIWINERKENTFVKVYEGMVVSKSPTFSEPDKVSISCQGFSVQLNRIIVGAYNEYVHTNWTVGWIVNDIMDKYVRNKTDIQYNTQLECQASGDSPTVSMFKESDGSIYMPQYISFTQSAWDCMNYLADIQGDVEWGVDKNRMFYFIPASDEVKNNFWYGNNIVNYKETVNYENIINRVWIKDKYFNTTYERSDDQEVSESNTTSDTVAVVGYQNSIIRQKFTTDKRSISKIQLKVGRVEDSFYSGSGFKNYIVNGNFESGSISPWTGVGTYTSASIDTDIGIKGSNSLRVRTLLPNRGISQDCYNVYAGDYTLRFYYRIKRGDFRVKIFTVDGGTESSEPILESDRYKDKSSGMEFHHENDLSFTLDSSHDAIRIYFISNIKFVADWYLDDVSIFADGSAIKINLIDADTGEILSQKLVNESYSIGELPTGVDSDNLVDFDVHYYGCTNDNITNYAIYIQRDGNFDENLKFPAFTFARDSAGDNTLQYTTDDGDTWNNYGKLWFKVYYNKSQELYGLHEENSANPPSTDAGMLGKWVDGYLSGKDRPLVKASFSVSGLREVLEKDTVPLMSLGRVAFRKPGGVLLPHVDMESTWTSKSPASNQTIAQSFKHYNDFQLDSITFRARRVGTPTGTVYIEIREDNKGTYNSSYVDNGQISLDASTISTGYPTTFSFDTAPELKANKIYWIVIYSDFAYDSSNRIQFVYKTDSDAYTDGFMTYDSGSGPEQVKYDLYFELNGKESPQELVLQTVGYNITENGLTASISAGEPIPDLALYLKRLELRIKNNTGLWG